MKKVIFSAPMAIKPCAKTLAQTRLSDKKWISKVSGFTLDIRQASDLLIHLVNCDTILSNGVKIDFRNREEEIFKALNSLIPIDEEDCKVIYKYNEDWKFFRVFFTGKEGEKVNIRSLHAHYTNATQNHIASREFYATLRTWLSETGKDYKFYNRRILASVKVF